MNKGELVRELKKLDPNDDHEAAHQKADDLLLDYINSQRVTSAFEAIEKWYS